MAAVGFQSTLPAREVTVGKMVGSLVYGTGKPICDVADEIGINYSTLKSLMYQETDRVDLKLLYKIATYFNKELCEFIGVPPANKPSSEEQDVIDTWHQLNYVGKSRLKDYMDDLANNEKYVEVSDKNIRR